MRTDAIATALIRYGLTEAPPTAGRAAYVLAHQFVAGTLQAGTPVVVDAVNADHEVRAGWVDVAHEWEARLVVLETALHDPSEHRRRVEERRPDLVGQVVPSWAQVQAQRYDAWDETQDGRRHLIDMSDTELGVAAALSHVRNLG